MLTGRAGRAGFTLVELLVALVLGGVVLGAVATSRRGTAGGVALAIARGDVRRQLRAAAGTVPATLRALDPAAGDLREAHDSVLELRATLGASVLCAVDAPAAPDAPPVARVLLPDEGLPVASWLSTPRAGDALLVLAATPGDGPDEAWRRAPVADVASSTLMPCLAAARPQLRVPLAMPWPAARALPPGAPVRLLRRVRWSRYRAADGRWYLGYRDEGVAGLDVVQPVAGPLDRRAGAGWQHALRFAARDGAGDPADTLARVARLEVHAGASVMPRGAPASAMPPLDSTHFVVAPRNARPTPAGTTAP